MFVLYLRQKRIKVQKEYETRGRTSMRKTLGGLFLVLALMITLGGTFFPPVYAAELTGWASRIQLYWPPR